MYWCDKIFGEVCMVDDTAQEYRDTMQEVMLDLKLKTDKFLKKLKEENKKSKVSFGTYD